MAADDIEYLIDGLPGAGDARRVIRIGCGVRQKLKLAAMPLDQVRELLNPSRKRSAPRP
ncbi:hypothetical protein [Mesorhizobium shangrilense]|uniref:Uncharacterized protein n=1 Tax=Mesorhizobium shangrilense TaxID=460060 RepID=A0ABV2DPV2_9HYPH